MQDKLRIVFMGTPEFAVESLKVLLASGHQVAGVVTAPDKPAGRGNKIVPSAVKTFAQEAGITCIMQPENLKSPEFHKELRSLNADLQVVVAFRMLPEVVWSMSPMGTINLHASLLPDYRGAAPINWTIINGETRTGVTTFFIEKEIDTGNILFFDQVEIGSDTTAGELHDILMVKGAVLLKKTVDCIAAGNYKAIPQGTIIANKKFNSAPKIFKEDCKIDWNNEGKIIHNLIRGLSPYPAAWTELSNEKESILLKIFECKFVPAVHNNKCGDILTVSKNYLKVAVSDGFIEIISLQLSGKRRMSTDEFLRGFQDINKYRISD